MRKTVMVIASALILAACSGGGPGAHASSAPSPNAVATLLIESKGVTMPLNIAARTLAFAPYFPDGKIVQAAVIPPLNVDQQKNHGIAIEYVAQGAAFVLSQWPRAGFDVPPAAMSAETCTPVPYKTDGVVWSTRNEVVMTLQPDGHVPPSRVVREARRLLQRGACGAKTPRSPPRSQAVS